MKKKPRRAQKRVANVPAQASEPAKPKLRPWSELDRAIFTIDRTVGIVSHRR